MKAPCRMTFGRDAPPILRRLIMFRWIIKRADGDRYDFFQKLTLFMIVGINKKIYKIVCRRKIALAAPIFL